MEEKTETPVESENQTVSQSADKQSLPSDEGQQEANKAETPVETSEVSDTTEESTSEVADSAETPTEAETAEKAKSE